MKIGSWEFSDELWKEIRDLSEKEMLEFCEKNVVVTDQVTGKLISISREDYDLDEHVDFVVCGKPNPLKIIPPGAVEKKCANCGCPIIFSPGSPTKPPAVCSECAESKKRNEQTKTE